MSWKPTVYPEDGATGMEILPEIVANFPIDVEEKSLKEGMALVQIEDGEPSLISIPCDIEIIKKDTNGDEVKSPVVVATSGITTEVTLTPQFPLEANAKYSVILGKDIQSRSVFDAVASGENTGIGGLEVSGNYEGLLASDHYTITIQEDGTESKSYYKWTRGSDAISQTYIRATRRSIEIDRGVFLKFIPGDYKVGDTFTLAVNNTDKLQDLYSWSFSTGSSEVLTPASESSTSVIQFPVSGGEVLSKLRVVGSTPGDRDVLVDLETETITIEFSEDLKGYTPEELKKHISISSEDLDDVKIDSLDFTC